MPQRALRSAAVGVLAMVLVGACGSSTSGSGSGGGSGSSGSTSAGSTGTGQTPTMAELSGGTWKSQSVTSPDHQLVQGSTIAMTFKPDSISVNAGCNTMSGGAAIAGDTLVVTQLASTMMGCEQALADQDQWVQEFLTSRPTIELLGADLRLAKGSTEIRYVKKP